MQSANVEPERVFKLLTLIAKAIHLSGEHSEVERTFDTHGGSIGRQDECDMVLPDPDRRISRLQARILHVDGRYAVCNASTSNPMYVNGVELSPGSSQVIGDGDELRAGSYVVTVSQTEEAPRQTSPQAGRQEVSHPRADTVSRANPPEQERTSSTADPLLAFGSSAGSGDDPFADLLGKAAPVNGATENGPETHSMAQPLPTATDGLSDQPAPEQSLSTPRGHSDAGPMAVDSPLAQQMPPNTSEALRKSESQNARARLAPDQNFDPNDPFGDLLAQAVPVRGDEGAFDAAGNTALAPDTNLGSAVWEGGQTVQGFYPSHAPPPPDTSNAQENLFDRPAAPETSRASRASGRLGEEALQTLAGNPFADLMGAPVEEHMAHAPPFDPVSKRPDYYIPDDFNPLASGGVAQRNSSDPLTPMGLNANGLADVLPVETIDSLYRPGDESPTTLAVDPLKPLQERVLQVEQSTDPLKLFANDARSLIPDDLGAKTGASTRDDAREMVAYFRAPVPRVDHDMLAARREEIDDAKALPPSSVLADSSADMTPAAGEESGALQALPPSAGPSEARHDVAAGESRQKPTQADGAEPFDSGADLSATPLPAATKPQNDSLSRSAGQPDDRAAEELMAAFKRGAGLQELAAASMTPQMMEILGHLLQTAVQGAVSLLAARAAIKQEIHLSVTLINPSSNNPMKFLPDGHTAMLQMLGPKMPGFMAPVEAMEEAFSDLLRHQTAIAAGTQATIEALFRRFDPDAIQSRYPKSGVGEKLSQVMHHARLWNLYVDQYRLIKEEIKDDFFKRLGSEFHDAYNREYDDMADDK